MKRLNIDTFYRRLVSGKVVADLFSLRIFSTIAKRIHNEKLKNIPRSNLPLVLSYSGYALFGGDIFLWTTTHF